MVEPPHLGKFCNRALRPKTFVFSLQQQGCPLGPPFSTAELFCLVLRKACFVTLLVLAGSQKFSVGAKLWAIFADYYECAIVDGYEGVAVPVRLWQG